MKYYDNDMFLGKNVPLSLCVTIKRSKWGTLKSFSVANRELPTVLYVPL